jgi:uncharacterized protein YbjT (DUF2867 family)
VFLLTPFVNNAAELVAPLLKEAKAVGVKHIVKLSAFGSEFENGIFLGKEHRAVERLIEGSGIAYTFLRPNNFFENFVNFYPPAPDGNIYLPWGEGKCSFIDGRDVAEVAVAALLSQDHVNKAYTLTGGEAFGIAEAAKILSEVTGRSIRYVDVPEEAAKGAMAQLGMPGWMVDAMMELHYIDKMNYAAVVTDELSKLLGRAPRSFRSFAQERAAAGTWKA